MATDFFIILQDKIKTMITSKTISNGILRAIATITAILVLLFFIYKIQSVIYYFIIAFIVSLIANPVIEFFRKRLKFSNTLAISITLSLFVLLFVGLAYLFVPLISSQGDKLSLLDAKTIQLKIEELYTQLDTLLKQYNISIKSIFNKSNASGIKAAYFTDFFSSILNALGNFGVGFVSVLFITFFLLKDKVYFIAVFKRIMPDQHEEQILNTITKINELLSRYFIGVLLQTLIIFVLYLIVLLIFGVENALIIALISALLNIIPYLGPLISTGLTALLILLSGLGSDFQSTLYTTLYVLIGYTIVQFLDNNVSNTIIASKSVKSHPLEVFIIIIIGGLLMGIIGMIIAVPVLTIIKVILKEAFPNNNVIQIYTKGI